MVIKRADATHYECIAKMYKKFLQEVYPDRVLSDDITIHRVVMSWYAPSIDLFVSINSADKVCGFSLDFIDTNGGTLSPIYRAEIGFTLTKQRFSKSTYMLMHATINRAKELGLTLNSKASLYNGTEKLHSKLGAKPIFTEMELKHER